MGWSVKIGNTGQFTSVSGGLSIRFLHAGYLCPNHEKYTISPRFEQEEGDSYPKSN